MRALHHVGYWVEDLDHAAEHAHRTLDVGPFLTHPHVTFDSFVLADGTEVEDAAYFDHSAAFALWGDLVLELGEVHQAHPDLVAAYGIQVGAVSHVSWVVDDLAAESRHLEEQGCALIHTAATGAVKVAWHHGGSLFPHPVEVHQAGAPILGMRPRLAALRETWDGDELMHPMVPAPAQGVVQ